MGDLGRKELRCPSPSNSNNDSSPSLSLCTAKSKVISSSIPSSSLMSISEEKKKEELPLDKTSFGVKTTNTGTKRIYIETSSPYHPHKSLKGTNADTSPSNTRHRHTDTYEHKSNTTSSKENDIPTLLVTPPHSLPNRLSNCSTNHASSQKVVIGMKKTKSATSQTARFYQSPPRPDVTGRNFPALAKTRRSIDKNESLFFGERDISTHLLSPVNQSIVVNGHDWLRMRILTSFDED